MKEDRKIAVIGYACKYPDADDVQQFWQNILARRRAFRDMPSKRLNKSYFSTDRTLPDHIYSNKVAVLKNYYFDRAKFKISNSNFQSADLTHWLALDVAAEAIKNASIEQLPKKVKEQTGVIVGNTLTGEFSRANLLRLRWPYVRDCAVKVLREQKRDDEQIKDFITNMEERYKNSFSAMEEDSLAGGLSNTIAGRICNYYDFNGGGYTIDGACSSSLLAVCKACDSILTGDLLLAIVGGVDISLDPFELVGFSRAGALATKEMLVYDNNSNGFWPGEGCGFAVFADYEFARERNLTIHATINGWGISSDGKGGLTRPSVDGQVLALQRAYKRAGYGIDTVAYLEGHGTGTSLGDATELTAIIKALENAPPSYPVHIGSVKANIGHTKAASGMAGLIKCLMVLKNRLIPAASGVREPNTLFNQTNHLKLPLQLISYDRNQPMRAGVSSMGFGGINTHITLEEHGSPFQNKDKTKAKLLSASYQDAELFLLAERNNHLLKLKLNILYEKVKLVSIAELTDLSCTLFSELQNFPCRLAIEAATPEQLAYKISKVIAHIEVSNEGISDTENGIYFCTSKMPLKIGFLFPGQGNEVLSSYGLLQERFPFLSSLLPEYLKNNTGSKSVLDTGFSQPSIVSTSLTAVKFLEQLGVRAQIALGHSLGELSALYWAEALTENAVIELAKERGRLMHRSSAVKGQMLSVLINYKDALIDKFVTEFDVSLACVNGATQIVFSGSKDNINALYVECKNRKILATLLPVENAFHSKLMKDVEEPFSRFLSSVPLSAPTKKVYSTVSRTLIKDEKEIYCNLINQLTHPVLFHESFERVCQEADLWIEVGPGNTLEKLANSISGVKCISLDFTAKSIRGILKVAGAMFVSDNPVNLEMLFENRYYRTLLPEEEITFLEGPCEKVPPVDETVIQTLFKSKRQAVEFIEEVAGEEDLEALFRAALAKQLDLPAELVFPHTRMLDDLHLNSLFIGQLLVDFAKKHTVNLTDTPSEYANASVDEIVQMFIMLRKDPSNEGQKIKEEENNIEGVDSWVFPFEINFEESLLQKKTNKFLSKPSSNLAIGNVPDHLSGIENREFIKDAKVLFVFFYAENEVEILNTFDTFLKLYKSQQRITHTVFIQQDPVSGGFAKSLYIEDQHSKVRVVELPAGELTDAILFSELSQPDGFIYAKYESGIRYIPQLSAIVDSQPFKSILPNNEDTILVTGGAKGITFECVCELAIRSRCKLVLLGRSDPGDDVQIKQNLARSKNQGIDVKYYTADVEDRQQLRKVIENIYLENTRITGIIHGAGINKPTRITELKFDQLNAVLGVKVNGLRNIFQEINTVDLKFCFTFGSIIAECGMEGNADYALANEWLRNEVASLSKRLPGIYFVNMAWSVWGGTGMGENLGVLERLKKRGIKPITLDSGINHFMKLF
ncbi:MAG: type I polyketide synthase, partial [Ginsengibacter sp.]